MEWFVELWKFSLTNGFWTYVGSMIMMCIIAIIIIGTPAYIAEVIVKSITYPNKKKDDRTASLEKGKESQENQNKK